MKLFTKLIFSFISNLASLFAATYFVKGFVISGNPQSFLSVCLLFTFINLFIRPVLKIIFSPLIILTLGLGIFGVNVLTLYILDYFSQNVSINGVVSLIFATLIISVINFAFHLSAKKLYK